MPISQRFRMLLLLPLLLTQAPGKDAEPGDYIRIHQTEDGEVQLQVVIREFVPGEDSPANSPALSLVGVTHIGEASYFQSIQTYLAGPEAVLFEGVGFYATKEERRKRQPGAGKSKKKDFEGSSQHKMADALGLTFQPLEINYDKDNFYNSDLSMTEFLQYFQPGVKGSIISGEPGEDKEARQFMAVMAGSSIAANIFQGVLRFFGQSPKLQGISRLVLIETLGALGNDLSQADAMPESMAKLMKLIIQRRNRVVLQDLKIFLRRKDIGHLAIFYGAGHMPDLEKRICKTHGYNPAKDIWVTCFSVNPQKSGLTPLDINFVRKMVSHQIQLQSE
jgi:hypothetical protein